MLRSVLFKNSITSKAIPRYTSRKPSSHIVPTTPISSRQFAMSNSKAPQANGDSSGANFEVAERIKGEVSKLDVWTVFSPAAGYMPKDALSLGQGFMSWITPEFVRKAATDAINAGPETNHYSHPRGRIRLRKALSDYMSESFFEKKEPGRKLDPETEILITSGANEGIFSILLAFVQEQDEVIFFEPFFDQYYCNTTFSQGVPRFVPIRPPASASSRTVSSSEWKVDIEELRRACNEKTRVIILNTPHNPIGKVFDEDELRAIGKVAEEFNCIILADEVYDCLAFEPAKHIRIGSLDNFWERTITVGSAGKSFAATGWRVGWCVGPAPLVRATLAASTRIIFSAVSPLQEATAAGLEEAAKNGFFATQRKEYIERRQVLMDGLDPLGLPYTIPDGAYFALVETSKLKVPQKFIDELPELVKVRSRDWHVAYFIAMTTKVVVIPPGDFYSPQHHSLGENFVRIAFCKEASYLKEAGERLGKLKEYIQ